LKPGRARAQSVGDIPGSYRLQPALRYSSEHLAEDL
jgi:hypothetical protein